MRRHLLVLILALSLVAAGCGDDDGDVETSPPTAADPATTVSEPTTTAAPTPTAPTTTAATAPSTTAAPGGNQGTAGAGGLGAFVRGAISGGPIDDNQCVADRVDSDMLADAATGTLDREAAIALIDAAEECGLDLTDQTGGLTTAQTGCFLEGIEPTTFDTLAATGDPDADALSDAIDTLVACDVDIADQAGLDGVTSEQTACLFNDLDAGTVDALLSGTDPTGVQFQELFRNIQTCGIPPEALFDPGELGDVEPEAVFCLFDVLRPDSIEALIAGQEPSGDVISDVLAGFEACGVDLADLQG